MILGENGFILANITNIDISTVDKVIFTLRTSKGELTKDYPTTVAYTDNTFSIPLKQEETLVLGKGLVKIEAQINYTSKAVSKVKIGSFNIEETLATEIVSDNNPINTEKLAAKMQNNTVIVEYKSLDISQEEGNALVKNEDGYYVGSCDYENLTNKPTLNEVEITGNLTSDDLNIAAKEHTHTISDITGLEDSLKNKADITNIYNAIQFVDSMTGETKTLTIENGEIVVR